MGDVTEFDIQVNVGNAGPVDVMMQDPSEGPHEITILDVKQTTKEGEGGKTSLRFSVSDTEPGSPTFGTQTMIIIGTDWTKPFNLGHLVNSLLSIGANPEKIKGVIRVNPAIWRGKKAFMFVKAKPEGEVDDRGRRALADKNFITPSQYTAAKKVEALRGAAPAPRVAVLATTAASPNVPVTTTMTVPLGVVPPPQANNAASDLGSLFS